MRLPLKSPMVSFRADRSGSITILFALAGVVAIGIAGSAVDYARWLQARQVTARAMDSAVLAGARALQLKYTDPAAALILAKQVYDSNVLKRTPLLTDSVQFITADGNTAVTATGDASIKTTLLGIIGIRDFPILTAGRSKFPKAKITSGGGGSSNIEVAVMLDVTGSMCDDGNGPCTAGTKLQGLRDAAKGLVNIVVQTSQTPYTSRVALVPFSTQIRVGPDGGGGAMMQSLTNLSPTWSGYWPVCIRDNGGTGGTGGENESPGTWACLQYSNQMQSNWKIKPCVTDRVTDGPIYNTTDDAPGSGRWFNGLDGSRRPIASDSANGSPGTALGQDASHPAIFWNYEVNGSCDEIPEANELMPLSSDKVALTARIDGLQAAGSTAGALGTAFAWYALSPKWNGVWPSGTVGGGYSDLTNIQANGQPRLRKIAVLMTDGGYNTYRGWKGQDQQAISDQAKLLCTNMKAAGIEIYTVGFALNLLPVAERAIATDTLRSCGTDLSHFYETLNVQQLQDAFTGIAMSLSTIYLAE